MIDHNAYERKTAMSKHDAFDYFTAFDQQSGLAEELALNLLSGLDRGELGSRGLMEALHVVEGDADEVNHRIQTHLAEDFVVPFERSGMASLAYALDDVSDATEDIAIKGYIFGAGELPESGRAMVKLLADACVQLKAATELLGRGARSRGELKQCLTEIQTLESECDALYIEAAHALYVADVHDERRRMVHSMLDAIEAAMDAAETAAERMEAMLAENA